jgi:LuxR family transcriptional regulator, maltose regulon positive regulatory protein
VLERQSEDVRRLLLHTSILERVNGPLADLLTGSSCAERILHELEEAGAFVTALDAQRRWFRYHPLFADLLQLELRRTAPDEMNRLHIAAAEWYAEHGYAVEAVRHAQTAGDWRLATRLLADTWIGLELSGRQASAHALLAAFPAAAVRSDPELAAMAATHQLLQGSLQECERYIALADRASPCLAADRRERMQVWLTVAKIFVASRRGDVPAVVEEAEQLLAPGEAAHTARLGLLSDEYRALALTALGEAELAAFRLDEAERYLEQALALARRAEQPFLELIGLAELAHLAAVLPASYNVALQRSGEAIEFAERHGWTEEPAAGVASMVLGGCMLMQGRLENADPLLARAERTLRPHDRPAAGALLHTIRGVLEMARGRDEPALAAFRSCERVATRLRAPEVFVTRVRALVLHSLVRLGQTERAEQVLAAMDPQLRATAEVRTAVAALRLAQGDAEAGAIALEPVLAGAAVARDPRFWLVLAFTLEARARDALGDAGGIQRALERALDVAEPDGLLLPFMVYPARELLERHRRGRTSHAALVSEILDLLAGRQHASAVDELREPLSESETRVLRYLPTNLSAPEIAGELHVSVSTVKTHIAHIYAKLGVHRRIAAVERGRALGLLARSALGPR